MMWDAVVKRIAATVMLDPALRELYQDNMRMAGTGAFQPAMLEWTFIADAEDELWSPVTIQFDQWLRSMEDVVISERRLRVLFHQDLPAEYGGLIMWAQYQDGAVLAAPDRDGSHGRSVRFRFTPLREKYAGLAETAP